MSKFLATNWLWIAFLLGMLVMHRHGGHGMHNHRRPQQPERNTEHSNHNEHARHTGREESKS